MKYPEIPLGSQQCLHDIIMAMKLVQNDLVQTRKSSIAHHTHEKMVPEHKT